MNKADEKNDMQIIKTDKLNFKVLQFINFMIL